MTAEYDYTGYEWSGTAPDGSRRIGRWIFTAGELTEAVKGLFDAGWKRLYVFDPGSNPVATIGPDPGSPGRLSWWTLESEEKGDG